MLKIGITGGIGSGKSTVCKVFESLGIPVFKADDAARYLMEYDGEMRQKLSQLLGDEIYEGGRLNRNRVSDIIFKNPEELQHINAIVHPATIAYGKAWMNKQKTPYVIKEAAIFFETDSYKEMDIMVGIYAPEDIRIDRAMKRGNLTREKVTDIVSKQMNEDEKMKRCDYVINNYNDEPIIPQVLKLHELFLQRSV